MIFDKKLILRKFYISMYVIEQQFKGENNKIAFF